MDVTLLKFSTAFIHFVLDYNPVTGLLILRLKHGAGCGRDIIREKMHKLFINAYTFIMHKVKCTSTVKTL